MSRPRIHRFADPLPLDGQQARRWLGSKGASLALMTRMDLPVPPGFTLSTDLWRDFDAQGSLPAELKESLRDEIQLLEGQVQGRFGATDEPLLLSVRSGGPTSMPGMLETVLDVGIDDAIAKGLGRVYGSPRFGLDVRRRFLESYATVVLGVPRAAFDALLGPRDVSVLDAEEIRALLAEMEQLVLHEVGEPVPSDPYEQLLGAIGGVLASWRAPRAQKYRDAHGIPDDEGTAVTIQAMVFGNLGPRSGSGVVFSRNPSTGERTLYGEWLRMGQGEDVVSGRRTPVPLMARQVRRGMEDESLESTMPEILEALRPLSARLEARYGDVVDIEVTVERGRLFVLQCRSAKRTARAAARIAVEMEAAGELNRKSALGCVDPASLRQLLTPRLPDPEALAARGLRPLARGLAASPGAATGRMVLDGDAVAALGDEDELVLVRAETSAEDVDAMRVVSGILTAAGGLTSHAAVVARAMGKPCVAGATSLHVDYVGRRLVARGDSMGPSPELREGDVLTIDGGRGLVYAAAVPVEPAPASPHVEAILEWADAARRAHVLAEARSPRLAQVGRSFGADGIAALGADPSLLTELLEAVGDGFLLADAKGEVAIRAALELLRPERDILLVSPEELAVARAARGEGTLPLWTFGMSGSDADGVFAHDLTPLDTWGPDTPLAFRADEGSGPELERALEGDRSVSIVVPPLDVAIARLLAAQVEHHS